jgi:hypothetical protein
MNKGDKEEIREMLTDILGGHLENIDGKFNVIDEKINSVIVQTTRTNGRVLKLEDKTQTLEIRDKEHIINCPIAERVKTLEDTRTGTKSIIRFIIQVITIAGIIGGILFGIYEISNK